MMSRVLQRGGKSRAEWPCEVEAPLYRGGGFCEAREFGVQVPLQLSGMASDSESELLACCISDAGFPGAYASRSNVF